MIQHKTDDPVQNLYSFSYNTTGTKGKASDLSQRLAGAGIKGTIKMVSMPIAKNKILVRFENIADLSDETSNMNYEINIDEVFNALYNDANDGNFAYVQYKEMSLTGNMELSEMLARKIKWKTVDDDKEGFVANNRHLEFHGYGTETEIIVVP